MATHRRNASISDIVMLFAGACLIALPFPTIYFAFMDAWYGLRGEVVEGVLVDKRMETRSDNRTGNRQTVYVATVRLPDQTAPIEIDLLLGSKVRVGGPISIERAPGPLYRHNEGDGEQYGAWTVTGGMWLTAAVIMLATYRSKRRNRRSESAD